MNLINAKKCIGCRALASDGHGWQSCELGFNVETDKRICGIRFIKPAEPCLKPRTIPQLFEATEQRRKENDELSRM